MKKRMYLVILILILALLLSACKSDEAKAVEEQIKAIGTVTEETIPAVEAARSAYDALSAEDQKSISNLHALLEAENAVDVLRAKAVEELIDAIGEIGPDSKEKIEAARIAHGKLTATQQGLVMNYQVLLDAESAFDAFIVEYTIDAIRDLENADPNNEEVVMQTEALYNSLNEDQKSRVDKAFQESGEGPLQDAKVKRVQKLIQMIDYEKGTPTAEQIRQMIGAIVAFQELPEARRADVPECADLEAAVKSYAKWASEREKTDKLYAREVYLQKIEDLTVEDMLNYPSSYKGKIVELEIEIEEIGTGLSAGTIRAKVVGTDQEVELRDTREIKEPPVVVGDIMTVYGSFEGTKTINITEKGSGWFGTDLFAKVTDRYDVPVIRFVYTSKDNLGLIAKGDPRLPDLQLDPEFESLFEKMNTLAENLG